MVFCLSDPRLTAVEHLSQRRNNFRTKDFSDSSISFTLGKLVFLTCVNWLCTCKKTDFEEKTLLHGQVMSGEFIAQR